jgi:hypothetical protein
LCRPSLTTAYWKKSVVGEWEWKGADPDIPILKQAKAEYEGLS